MVAKQSAFSPLLCAVTFDMPHARIQIIPPGAGAGVPKGVNAFKSSALFHRGPYRTILEAIGNPRGIAS